MDFITDTDLEALQAARRPASGEQRTPARKRVVIGKEQKRVAQLARRYGVCTEPDGEAPATFAGKPLGATQHQMMIQQGGRCPWCGRSQFEPTHIRQMLHADTYDPSYTIPGIRQNY